MKTMAARLLISVRDADEAEAALRGGADVIDIKEPARGSLGWADRQVVERVTQRVAGRAPVSVALGELGEIDAQQLRDWKATLREAEFVKMGLARARVDWPAALLQGFKQCGRAASGAIAVAYADAHCVGAPNAQQVVRWAGQQRISGVLIDTAMKDGRDLFDHLTEPQLVEMIEQTRRSGLIMALAGSLYGESLLRAVSLGPDIIAVRGGACTGRDRQARIDADRVVQLKAQLLEGANATVSTLK